MVGAFEGEDPRLAGREQRGPKRDLDRVLTRDAELRWAGQPSTELDGDLSLREIAERVHDPLGAPGREDLRIPVPERSDSEAGGEVEVFPAVGVDDAAAFRLGPDQAEPLRRGTKRPSASAAM